MSRLLLSDEGFYVDTSKPSVEGNNTFEECDPCDVVEELEGTIATLQAQLKEARS